jgi:hypothetical protein
MDVKLNIDWKLLREQKLFLLAMADSPSDYQRSNAWGLINLLDDIQDRAVDSGEATAEEVFGPVESEFGAAPYGEAPSEFDWNELSELSDRIGQQSKD